MSRIRYSRSRISAALPVMAILLAPLAIGACGREGDCPAGEAMDAEHFRFDLETLANDLRTHHPQPFAHISEPAFDALTARLLAQIDAQTTKRELLWAFSELVASVGCGHTTLPYFNQEDALIAPPERFPVDVTLVDGRLYVLDPLVNGARLGRGDEIVAINGVPADELVAEALKHIPADGHNAPFKASMFRAYATGYLTYALGFPGRYTVAVAGATEPVALAPLSAFEHRPVVPSDAVCQDTLCLDAIGDPVALMTIRSWDFYGDRQTVFKTFVDESFGTLGDSEAETLIIDVRGNLGGSGFATAYLLRHLARAELRYFHPQSSGAPMLKQALKPIETGWSGCVIVLADEQTQSSTGHFLSLIRAHGLARIVGRASGAGATVHDNSMRLVSKHAGIEYKVAQSTFFTDVPDDRGGTSIAPDVRVPMTPQDVLEGRDAILARALVLANIE